MHQHGKRDGANIIYNTSLPEIFAIESYAKVLMKMVEKRNIILNTRHNLVEVKSDTKEAVFDILDENGKAEGQKTFTVTDH